MNANDLPFYMTNGYGLAVSLVIVVASVVYATTQTLRKK